MTDVTPTSPTPENTTPNDATSDDATSDGATTDGATSENVTPDGAAPDASITNTPTANAAALQGPSPNAPRGVHDQVLGHLTISIPSGEPLRFFVREDDGTYEEVEGFHRLAPALLATVASVDITRPQPATGSPSVSSNRVTPTTQHATSDPSDDTVEFGYFEIPPDTRFYLNDTQIMPQTAVNMFTTALIDALTEAAARTLRHTPTTSTTSMATTTSSVPTTAITSTAATTTPTSATVPKPDPDLPST